MREGENYEIADLGTEIRYLNVEVRIMRDLFLGFKGNDIHLGYHSEKSNNYYSFIV